MPLNVPLLRRIQKHILEEPARVDMDGWISLEPNNPPSCGTTGCIAGWAVLLDAHDKNKRRSIRSLAVDLSQQSGIGNRASSLLGVSYVGNMFMVDYWPAQYEAAINKHRCGTPKYAQAVSDFIDYVIDHPGKYER